MSLRPIVPQCGAEILLTMLVSVLVIVSTGSAAWAHPKTDVIDTITDDHLFGEIKELDMGMLTVKTHDMGTVSIKWDKITGIHSTFLFRVTSADGTIYMGSLDMEKGSGMLKVAMIDAVASIPRESVVELLPLDRTFFSRVDGSLQVGFNFTKASRVTALTLDWTAIYRGERKVAKLSLSSGYTNNAAADEITRRVDVSASVYRLMRWKRFFYNGTAGYQRNDELDLRNRYLLSASVGINGVQTNHNLMQYSLGLAYNAEESGDSLGWQNSLEAVATFDYSLFIYDRPKTNVDVSFDFYPSLTQSRRYRLQLNASARREIMKDFFVGASYYTSTDNKSPATGGWKADYGYGLTISWTY